jgi:hypothetical protein
VAAGHGLLVEVSVASVPPVPVVGVPSVCDVPVDDDDALADDDDALADDDDALADDDDPPVGLGEDVAADV